MTRTTGLDWLPPLPDWRARIASLEGGLAGRDIWDELVDLARHRLSVLQTERLDQLAQRLVNGDPTIIQSAHQERLAVLGSATVSHLLPSIRVAALRRGCWLQTFEADYGQYRSALLDETSAFHAFSPTFCLLALDARHLVVGIDVMLDEAAVAAEAQRIVDDLRSLWRKARRICRGQVMQQTLLPVFPSVFGTNEHRLSGAPAALVMRFNALLRTTADEEGVDLVAVDSAAAQQGFRYWYDPLLWHRAKQEVSLAAAPLYGELVARVINARLGRSAKCLVLDLDNTLWGGVLGDDGVEEIDLGQGTAAGEAFLEFQHYCLALSRRGILLAICSKNDEANVFAALDHHPEMVLRREHFSAIAANWDDKAVNLRRLAGMMNIGLDALVFADDNPFERNLVRQELPMVQVPELPDDPAFYSRCISDAGYFETLTITAEDRGRTEQYAANWERQELLGRATDMAGYLASLDMRLRWKRFDRAGLKRVVQLVNKTNQFNLTTRRYAEDEIERIMADGKAVGLQFRLLDRFGDNGVIGIVIGRLDDNRMLELETFLMSCRVLGRHVERAMVEVVAGEAMAAGAEGLIGVYRPTAKNAMVATMYPSLGFTRMAAVRSDAEKWSLSGGGKRATFDLPMTIEQE